jgi:hypothetical protein
MNTINCESKERVSRPCTYNELISPDFVKWTQEIKESPTNIWRKIWEYDFIADTLAKHGMLIAGKKGLGFAVGQEPLPALFAKRGCKILATDLDYDGAKEGGWTFSGQHTDSLEVLNTKGICDSCIFSQNVSLKYVDMNNISDDLRKGKFDFIWSSCALEHLGSIKRGKEFINNSMDCLKPGGIAVHTTEYNISSNTITLDSYIKRLNNVILRKRDIEDISSTLIFKGHEIHLNFELGDTPSDMFVDVPPYKMNPHIRLKIASRFNPIVCTSYGIIVKKR